MKMQLGSCLRAWGQAKPGENKKKGLVNSYDGIQSQLWSHITHVNSRDLVNLGFAPYSRRR